MKTTQLTARASSYCLADPDVCRRTWTLLRRRWSLVLGACLMGNHLHVLVEDVEPAIEAAWLLRALRRTGGWPGVEVEAGPVLGRTKVRRHVRYIALNPCRARIASDPLEWLWSTHRELFGAVSEPWVDRSAILSLDRSVERHHAYVSADPRVAVSGTAPPVSEPATSVSVHPLGTIARAAAVATRGGSVERRGPTRDLFLHLARLHGWYRTRHLAQIVGVSRRAVTDTWNRPVDVGPGLAVLGDRRLLAARWPSARRDFPEREVRGFSPE